MTQPLSVRRPRSQADHTIFYYQFPPLIQFPLQIPLLSSKYVSTFSKALLAPPSYHWIPTTVLSCCRNSCVHGRLRPASIALADLAASLGYQPPFRSLHSGAPLLLRPAFAHQSEKLLDSRESHQDTPCPAKALRLPKKTFQGRYHCRYPVPLNRLTPGLTSNQPASYLNYL